MSPPVRVLIGLGLGLASGFALAHANVPPDSILVTTADTIGGLWIAALRMTILPLVFSLVVTGVATRVEANSAGGCTRLSLLTFVGILLAGSAIVAITVPTLLSLWPTSPEGTAAIRQALSTGNKLPPLPGLGAMLKGFVPINVFSAAAADNMPKGRDPDVEERVELREPVPVFVTYLTVEAKADGVVFRADPYGRDPAVLARYFAEERQLAAARQH